MEQRLIDAEALNGKYRLMYDAETGTQVMAIADFTIDAQPTIEAEPVRHGKWIPCTSSEHWKSLCSECGCRAGYWFNEENSGIASWERDFSEWLSDNCPNCGARMDKE